jgi:hypothetical protein
MKKSCIITVTQGDFNYIREWIEYHHNIGIDLILIGYNGKPEEFDKMPKYDYVRYFDFSIGENEVYDDVNAKKRDFFAKFDSDEEIMERKASIYNNILNTLLSAIKFVYHSIDYAFIIDSDEFINLHNNFENISDFLEYNADKIEFCAFMQMVNYTNDDIYYEDKPCQDRFTKKVFHDNRIFDLDSRKTIVNCNSEKFLTSFVHSPHHIGGTEMSWVFGHSEIELKHFFTKSLEEWISKFNTNIDRNYLDRFRGNVIRYYFYDFRGNLLNEITEEKMKAIPQLLKKYNVDYDPSTEEFNNEIRELYKQVNNL